MWFKAQVTTEEKWEIRTSLHNILTPFIWTLLAFSWTMVVQEILNIFEDKYQLPEVAIIISIVYAVTMTIFWIAILIWWKRILNALVDLAVTDERYLAEKNKKKDEDFE